MRSSIGLFPRDEGQTMFGKREMICETIFLSQKTSVRIPPINIYTHPYTITYTYIHAGYIYIRSFAKATQYIYIYIYAMFMNKHAPTAVPHWSFQQMSWLRGKFLSVTPDAHNMSSSQARAPGVSKG